MLQAITHDRRKAGVDLRHMMRSFERFFQIDTWPLGPSCEDACNPWDLAAFAMAHQVSPAVGKLKVTVLAAG
ncbi:hypothetical protein RISK_005262 [Rhodopirellula islandica]|uniref:Uncharacterized protein n=1 Tax=Rhodopirellula islandica TaxID=595434 RepID=A0A0J1B6U0_RHOIS|nr:hypothetical protein RISK_005262 [Rhodopirellula islandica]